MSEAFPFAKSIYGEHNIADRLCSTSYYIVRTGHSVAFTATLYHYTKHIKSTIYCVYIVLPILINNTC